MNDRIEVYGDRGASQTTAASILSCAAINSSSIIGRCFPWVWSRFADEIALVG